MKMVMAVIRSQDSNALLDSLTQKGFTATLINSRGGFTFDGNATVFCGIEDEHLEEVLALIRTVCRTRTQYITPLPPVMELGELHLPDPVEKNLGGATIFVWPIERFEQS